MITRTLRKNFQHGNEHRNNVGTAVNSLELNGGAE